MFLMDVAADVYRGGRTTMAEFTVKINANFDNISEIISEIASLQTYKLFPGDNMLLISRDDLVEILKRHVISERVNGNG